MSSSSSLRANSRARSASVSSRSCVLATGGATRMRPTMAEALTPMWNVKLSIWSQPWPRAATHL